MTGVAVWRLILQLLAITAFAWACLAGLALLIALIMEKTQ